MRLIDVETLHFKSFDDPVTEPYAILSHTWAEAGAEDEVSFEEFGNREAARLKPGFDKIVRTCEQAKLRGLRYAWVDTCCIDKSSSAELSEAINSMFRWYKGAAVCFAYLEDAAPLQDSRVSEETLGKCRWFTRGWTLQELIAPKSVLFFDREWHLFGAKAALGETLKAITGIDRDVLVDSAHMRFKCVAQRMSWASKRTTRRVEDQAYSLMGIFDVNMPMIYGEGRKAFARLQEEILKKATELSLFAWTAVPGTDGDRPCRGLLAHSPAEFSGSGNVVPNDGQFSVCGEIAVTNQGIKLNVELMPVHSPISLGVENLPRHGLYNAFLHVCTRQGLCSIYLIRWGDTYVRVFPTKMALTDFARYRNEEPILIVAKPDVDEDIDVWRSRGIALNILSKVPGTRVSGLTAVPRPLWDPHFNFIHAPFGHSNLYCALIPFSVDRVYWVPGTPRVPGERSQFLVACMFARRFVGIYSKSDIDQMLFGPDLSHYICPFNYIDHHPPSGHRKTLDAILKVCLPDDDFGGFAQLEVKRSQASTSEYTVHLSTEKDKENDILWRLRVEIRNTPNLGPEISQTMEEYYPLAWQ